MGKDSTREARRLRWGIPSGVAIGVVMLVVVAGVVTAGAGRVRWTPVAGQPLAEPAEIHSANGVLTAKLVADERTIDVAGDQVTARVYNGAFTGPTLFVKPGDLLRVTLVNHLDEPTNLHFHGFHVIPTGSGDNVFREVQPGNQFTYRFRLGADEPPGLAWYHSHMHHKTEEQVFGGMSGMIVVQGLQGLLPIPLRHVTQRLLALRDIRVQNGKVATTGLSTTTTRLVDSQFKPEFSIAPGETQMWRFVNLGADLFYKVAMPTPDGPLTMHVIAEDGRPVWNVWDATSLVLPPGKRYEVLVQGPDAGDYQLKAMKYHQGQMNQDSAAVLATVHAEGPAQTPATLPTSLGEKEDLRNRPVAKTVRLNFGESLGQFTINGRMFDPERVDQRARLGTVQKWVITNDTFEQHPFHMHIDYFQVVRAGGKAVDANGLQDTVIVPANGGQVVILIEFEDYVGKFVFHCHILNHEDHGMMGTIVVSKPS